MIPSTRFASWFATGALLWVAAAALPGLLVVAGLYNVVLIFVAVLDFVLSPQPDDFTVEREASERMDLGAPNTVTLSARMNKARSLPTPIALTLRDEPPLQWPVLLDEETPDAAPKVLSSLEVAAAISQLAAVSFQLKPLHEERKEYKVTPTRRGDFQFGKLTARYKSLLGFWHRQFSKEADHTVRVYPDTTEVRRYELRLRQGRLRELGLHLLRLRGQGTEFESLREYSTDDEYKNINWKATARRGSLIVNDYEIERDQTVVVAIDCGRMMTSMAIQRGAGQGAMGDRSGDNIAAKKPSQTDESETSENLSPFASSPVPLSKLDCAINATVLLAHVAASMGDAVGLLLFSDSVLGYVPPRKGRTQTGAIIEALYGAQPSLVEPDYMAAYEYLIARKVRRALVVTFTDLVDPEASRELLASSGSLRRHHNPLCVTINNRDVIEMADQLPESTLGMYQKSMAQRMLWQRTEALEKLRHNGVGILDVPAEQLTVDTVNRYLDLKSRAAL